MTTAVDDAATMASVADSAAIRVIAMATFRSPHWRD
jgi:hypothetical protein